MFDAVIDVAVVTFGTGLAFGLKLDSTLSLKGKNHYRLRGLPIASYG